MLVKIRILNHYAACRAINDDEKSGEPKQKSKAALTTPVSQESFNFIYKYMDPFT